MFQRSRTAVVFTRFAKIWKSYFSSSSSDTIHIHIIAVYTTAWQQFPHLFLNWQNLKRKTMDLRSDFFLHTNAFIHWDSLTQPCFALTCYIEYNQRLLRETFRNKTLTSPPLHGHRVAMPPFQKHTRIHTPGVRTDPGSSFIPDLPSTSAQSLLA